MKNPYKVLELPLNATPSEIVRAQVAALRKRKYSNKEITEAQSVLRKPATRLAADFTFPIFEQEAILPITSKTKSKNVKFESIDINKYNSLK